MSPESELVVLRLGGFPAADVLVLAGLCLLGAPLWRLVAARLDRPEPAPAPADPDATTGD